MRIEFFVRGTPQPQGSTRAFMPRGGRFPIVTSDNKSLKPWRQDVSGMAANTMGGNPPTEKPVRVQCEFSFLRPKSTSKRVPHKITKPDIDKLARGILDALTSIVFRDDSQVIALICTKDFAPVQGAHIVVETVS